MAADTVGSVVEASETSDQLPPLLSPVQPEVGNPAARVVPGPNMERPMAPTLAESRFFENMRPAKPLVASARGPRVISGVRHSPGPRLGEKVSPRRLVLDFAKVRLSWRCSYQFHANHVRHLCAF